MNRVQPPTGEDVLTVLQSADRLDISEFRLFQIAYAAWYGQETDESTIERYFASYLFHEDVPFWVRHFTRQITPLDADDSRNLQAFGLAHLQTPEQELIKGRRHALLVMLGLVLVLWLGDVCFGWLDALIGASKPRF